MERPDANKISKMDIKNLCAYLRHIFFKNSICIMGYSIPSPDSSLIMNELGLVMRSGKFILELDTDSDILNV